MAKKGVLSLDPEVVQEAMVASGLSPWKISQCTGTHLKTVQKAVAGEAVRESSVLPILNVLRLRYSDAVIDHTKRRKAEIPTKLDTAVNEWRPVEVLSNWLTTPNGLQYKIWRMEHSHLEGRLARGKQYDLSIPSTKEQDRLRTSLKRHPEVCSRFRGHPHIAVNLTAVGSEDDDTWWVIDEWTAGSTLADLLREGSLDTARLQQVMLEIALGLKALHEQDIVRRELCPRFVLLRETDGSVVLTDFEMAKLLAGAPTVAGRTWPENLYLAPEVGGVEIDHTADLYSWARILVHAVCGEEALRGDACRALREARLPKRVQEITGTCLHKVCTKRPRSMDEVIRVVRKWR